MVSVMDMLSRSVDGAGVADVAGRGKGHLERVGECCGKLRVWGSNPKTLRPARGMRERHMPNSVPRQILSHHHTKTTLSGIRYHHRGNGDPAACRNGR